MSLIIAVVWPGNLCMAWEFVHALGTASKGRGGGRAGGKARGRKRKTGDVLVF